MSRTATVITPTGPVDVSSRVTGQPRVQRGQGLGATTSDDPTRLDLTMLDSDGLLDPARSSIGVGRSTLIALTAQPPGQSTHRSEFSGSLSSTTAGWGSEVDEGLDWSTPAGQATTWSVSGGFGRAFVPQGDIAETKLWDTTRNIVETGEDVDVRLTVDAISGLGNVTTIDASLGRDGRTGRGEGAWVSARIDVAPGGITAASVRYENESGIDTFVAQELLGALVSANPELLVVRIRIVANYVGIRAWLSTDTEPEDWAVWQRVPAVRQVSGSTTLRLSHNVAGSRTIALGRIVATRRIARAVGEAQSWDYLRSARPQDSRVNVVVTSPWQRLGLSRLGLSPLSRTLPTISGALAHWSMEDGPQQVMGPGQTFAVSPGMLTSEPLTLVSRLGVGEVGTTSGRTSGIPGSGPVPIMVTARARARLTSPQNPNTDTCSMWAYVDLGESSRTNEVLVFADIRIGDGRRWICAITQSGGARIEGQDLESTTVDFDTDLGGPILVPNRGAALIAIEWEVTGATTMDVRVVGVAVDGTQGIVVSTGVAIPSGTQLRLSQAEVAAAGGEFVGLGHVVAIQPSGSDALPSVFDAVAQARAYRGELSTTRVRRVLTEIGETPGVPLTTGLDRCGEQPLTDPIGVLNDSSSPAGSIADDRGSGRIVTRLRQRGRPHGVDSDHRGELAVDVVVPWAEIRRDRVSRLDVRRTASSIVSERPDGSRATATTDERADRDADAAQLTSDSPPSGIGALERLIRVNAASVRRLPGHAAWTRTAQSASAPRLGDLIIETFSSQVSEATAAAVATVSVGDIVDVTDEPGAVAEGYDRARVRVIRQQEDLLGGDPRNVRYTWTCEPARRSIVGVWADPASSSGPTTRWSPPASPVVDEIDVPDTTTTLVTQAPAWTTDTSAYPVRVVIFDRTAMTREVASVTAVSGRTLTLSRTNPVEHPAGALVTVEDDGWTGRYAL